MSERICLACKHFSLERAGCGDYADPATAACDKGHWATGMDAAELFEANLTARTCPDYELSELAISHGWKP